MRDTLTLTRKQRRDLQKVIDNFDRELSKKERVAIEEFINHLNINLVVRRKIK